MKFKYLFFLLEKTNDFFWREECIDFKRNLTDSTLIKKKKNVKFYMAEGISLGIGFWVVNT